MLPVFERESNLESDWTPTKQILADQSEFTYTFSIWLKNMGGQAFTPYALEGGRNPEFQFFVLDECFSLWFDSPTSFRVYAFTFQDMFETTSPSIFVPLNQWYNIQVTVSSDNGISIWTFNTNGERQ